MVLHKHLDPDYELSHKQISVVSHFFETIESIGGLKGLGILSLAILAFYGLIIYTIQNGRKKREAAKLGKRR